MMIFDTVSGGFDLQLSTTEIVVLVVAVVALIAVLASRRSGPRITEINRTVTREKEGDE